jgi:hypothetical protein
MLRAPQKTVKRVWAAGLHVCMQTVFSKAFQRMREEPSRMTQAGAAHLKFLEYRRHFLSRNFKWQSGTRNDEAASAHDFPKFVKGGC